MHHLQRREDLFGNLYVIGEEFERENGTRGWYIMSWSGANPLRAYWVENAEFHDLGVRMSVMGSDKNLFEIGAPVNVPAAERETVLQAIGMWTDPGLTLSAASGM